MLLQGPELASPAAPLNQLLLAGLQRAPDEIAMVSIVRSMTWRELDRESSALAGGYRTLGLNEGDRLASLMPNRIDLAVHYLACFKAGLVATPLNYRYTSREIDHALEVSGADALLVHVERADDVAASAMAGGLRCGLIAYRDEPGERGDLDWAHDYGMLLQTEPLVYDPAPDPTIPAVIFFTSGSTGPAKGVTHTRESLRWMIASAAAAFALDAGDVFLPVRRCHTLVRFYGRWPRCRLGAGSWWCGRSTVTSCCRCCANTGRLCWRCCRRR
jgi:long-chain acyl-CoA synthetase